MVQKQGCSSPENVHYFGFATAVRLTDREGGGRKSLTIHYFSCQGPHTAWVHGNRTQLWLGSVTRDKIIKNGAWRHSCFQKANMSVYAKLNNLFAFTPSLNSEGQRESSPAGQAACSPNAHAASKQEQGTSQWKRCFAPTVSSWSYEIFVKYGKASSSSLQMPWTGWVPGLWVHPKEQTILLSHLPMTKVISPNFPAKSDCCF